MRLISFFILFSSLVFAQKYQEQETSAEKQFVTNGYKVLIEKTEVDTMYTPNFPDALMCSNHQWVDSEKWALNAYFYQERDFTGLLHRWYPVRYESICRVCKLTLLYSTTFYWKFMPNEYLKLKEEINNKIKEKYNVRLRK